MLLSTSHLRCDFSVKGASVKRCSFPTLCTLRASFDWTLGCLNRWRRREPNQPCNPPLGLPQCFHKSTWRICCTTMPCGSLDIREAGLKPLSKLNRIWKVCLSVCSGSGYCSSLYSHLIQMTLFGLQGLEIAAFFLVQRLLKCCFKLKNIITYNVFLLLFLKLKCIMW